MLPTLFQNDSFCLSFKALYNHHTTSLSDFIAHPTPTTRPAGFLTTPICLAHSHLSALLMWFTTPFTLFSISPNHNFLSRVSPSAPSSKKPSVTSPTLTFLYLCATSTCSFVLVLQLFLCLSCLPPKSVKLGKDAQWLFIVALVDDNGDWQMVLMMKLPPPYFLHETMQDSDTLISKSCGHCSWGINSSGWMSIVSFSHQLTEVPRPHDLSLLKNFYSILLFIPECSTKIISSVLIFIPQLNYHRLLEGRAPLRYFC